MVFLKNNMNTITSVFGREILDSRGNPTVEVDVRVTKGFGRAAVPSGASTGSHEAVELRDGGNRYGGKGVERAVKAVNTVIKEKIVGRAFDQQTLDEALILLDGTANKSRLGANAILGVSLAFSRACADAAGIPLYQYFAQIAGTEKEMKLPVPMMNILNGGRHAEHSTDIQEFMIMPVGAPNFKEALRYGAETFQALKKILSEKGMATTVGDEGGFAVSLPNNETALQLIVEAITKAGYKPGSDIAIAIDAAASEFYKDGKYVLASENKTLSADQLIDLYEAWTMKYPIRSIEDIFAEDDWDAWVAITKRLGKKVQIVGDDLFTTNVERLKKGIELGACNSILIKLNQIGTVTETIAAIAMAKKAGYTSIISHRSGETEDTIIADFAVGLGTGQIKTGSVSRSERVAKYNQLLRIYETDHFSHI